MKNEAARSKLNELLMHWPKGTVAVQHWLREQGIPRQLAERYRSSNWMERIGQGAYTRAGDKVGVAEKEELQVPFSRSLHFRDRDPPVPRRLLSEAGKRRSYEQEINHPAEILRGVHPQARQAGG